jgi:hypothetical protein
MNAMGQLNPTLVDLMTTNHRPGVILADAYVKFKRPLTFPDNLLVGIRTEMGPDSAETTFKQHYKILSASSGRVAAEGHSVVVIYDYKIGNVVVAFLLGDHFYSPSVGQGKRAPIPQSIRDADAQLNGPGLLVLDIPTASGPVRLV